MGKAYSIDLRQKIIDAYENDEGSMRILAKRFKVSFSFVTNLLKRYFLTGNAAPKAYGGGRKAKACWRKQDSRTH